MENSEIRDIDPTTKRLVERCLSGEWCNQYRKPKAVRDTVRRDAEVGREGSPGTDSVTSTAQAAPEPSTSRSSQLARQGSARTKALKTSRSVENLKGKSKPPRPPRSNVTALRRPSGDSTSSLPGVAATISPVSKRRDLSRSGEIQGSFAAQQAERYHEPRNTESLRPHPPVRSDSLDACINGFVTQPHTHPPSPALSLPTPTSPVSLGVNPKPHRRSAPPAPAKRRKPPAVPAEKTNSGATFTAIASSNPAPKVMKSSSLQHTIA
jgi:hypothetical protein